METHSISFATLGVSRLRTAVRVSDLAEEDFRGPPFFNNLSEVVIHRGREFDPVAIVKRTSNHRSGLNANC